jgi:energy-coupling factor transporter ATP-binding protein EcfA2
MILNQNKLTKPPKKHRKMADEPEPTLYDDDDLQELTKEEWDTLLPPCEKRLFDNVDHDPQSYIPHDELFNREKAKQLFIDEMSETTTATQCFTYMSQFFCAINFCNSTKKTIILYLTKTPTECSTQECPLFTNEIQKIPMTQINTQFNDMKVYVNIKVVKGDKETRKPKKYYIFDEFMNSSHFVRYDKSCFDPPNLLGAPVEFFGRHYNTYTGLPIDKYQIDRVFTAYELNSDYDYTLHPSLCCILNHIKEVLCNNHEEIYNYFINWLAYIFQNAGRKTQVMVIFVGSSGCGKSTLFNWLRPLFGHYMESKKTSELGQQFIGHEFNEKFLVTIDEWNIRELHNSHADGLLKNLVTDTTIRVEAKFVQGYSATSHNNFLASSNYAVNLVPSSLGYFRRMLIVNCGETRGPEYFKTLHQTVGHPTFNKHRYSLSMHMFAKFLLDRDLSEYVPTEFPITEFQVNCLTNGWRKCYKWWYIVLKRGYIIDKSYLHDKKMVENMNSEHCKQFHEFTPENEDFKTFYNKKNHGLRKQWIYDQYTTDMIDIFNMDTKSTKHNKNAFFTELGHIIKYHEYSFDGYCNMISFPSQSECIRGFYLAHMASGLKIQDNPFRLNLGPDNIFQYVLDMINGVIPPTPGSPSDDQVGLIPTPK